MEPNIGMTTIPLRKLSTALCDFALSILFSAPYLNSNTVISEM